MGTDTTTALHQESETLQTFNEYRQRRETIPVIDRHLLEKEASYFWKSSKETLIIWEDRMKKVLKSIQVRAPDQPCIQFPPVINEDERH